jgi:hypothetical protein
MPAAFMSVDTEFAVRGRRVSCPPAGRSGGRQRGDHPPAHAGVLGSGSFCRDGHVSAGASGDSFFKDGLTSLWDVL